MSVRNAILGLLAQQPHYAYELHAAFEAVVGGEAIWDIKPSQVYTTLTRLEESGLVRHELVESEGSPDKRIYNITPAGEEAMCEWFASPVHSFHQRDEFFLKLMMALATRQGDPLKVIQVQRASLYQELHGITADRSQTDQRQELARVLLLDQAVMHLEADLRWLDMVEARLDEVKSQPIPKAEIRPRGRPSLKSNRR